MRNSTDHFGWRSCFLLSTGILCAASLFGQRSVTDNPKEKRPKPFYDAFLASPIRKTLTAEQQTSVEAAAKPGTQVQMEERLGVPTFLWAAQGGKSSAAAGLRGGKRAEEIAARAHLNRHGKVYQLSSGDLESATLTSIHNTGRGPVIVKLRQSIGGVEVFREEINVAMTQSLELIGISGYLTPSGAVAPFSLQPQEAIARAMSDLLDESFSAGDFTSSGESATLGLYAMNPQAQTARGVRVTEAVRTKKVIYRLPDRLEPAYYVEVVAQPAKQRNSLGFSYVISATDGRMLFRKNLISHAEAERQGTPFTYRVWALDNTAQKPPMDGPQGIGASPHPTGTPNGYQPSFVQSRLVTLANGPISTRDPWLPAGQTQTIGNNVEAYADIDGTDGFTPASADIHAQTNGARTFNRVYHTTLQPNANSEQTQAAITHLFYVTNFLHDWFYDAGFDEASGNAQTNNYGRGGVAGDRLKAEGQDFAGLNNADMMTPADGGSPRMQMYLWSGIGDRSLTVNSPSQVAGAYPVGIAEFGPQTFEIGSSLVLVNDGVAATSVSDGCEFPFVNAAAVNGKIAFIDRGNCAFVDKVLNAQASGAVGVVIANNESGFFDMGGFEPSITIGSLLISLEDGNKIKPRLSSTVNASLIREFAVDRDGSIDSQIISHEWGHYLSNRLIGNAAGLGTNISNGLGEGWSDFVSQLLTVRREDSKVPSNANFSGVYAFDAYPEGGGQNGPLPNNSYYFGIRRVPYSTNFAKNSFTFKHISDAVPLPGNIPLAFIPAPNSEVHNTGEIWATMLWECYAALLRDTLPGAGRLTFEKAQERMLEYLVASLKLTPINPTLIEARNALLAVARATDARDFTLFWQAFAKRGAGTGAIAPDRYAYDNTPVVESYIVGGALTFVDASLADDVTSCDRDGYLDAGETGSFKVTLRNEGARRLVKTTATLSSNNPNVSFPDGNTLSFPATEPFESATQSVRIALKAGSPGKQSLAIQISFTDPALNPAGPFKELFATYANINVQPNTATSDNVESPVSSWTPVVAIGVDGWERDSTSLSPLNYAWHGPDPGLRSDISLVSPVLKVGTQPFSFTFRHRFSFEFDEFDRYDGGIIELSADGGATWKDIGVGYNGAIAGGAGNPLERRRAYTAISTGYPSFRPQTINLGTAYRNKNVLVRFRVGADVFTAAPGWDVDEISFTGLTNKPFHTLVGDAGCR